jgi:hypothetical protein
LSRPRVSGYFAIASAVAVAGVLISASLVTVGEATKTSTITKTSISTLIETKTCPVTTVYGTAPVHPFVYVYTNATTGIHDLWNATVTGYSGSTQVFSQCFMGVNIGEIYDFGVAGGPPLTLVKVTAQKMVGNHDNMTLNVHGLQNSTSLPYGLVSLSTNPNF